MNQNVVRIDFFMSRKINYLPKTDTNLKRGNLIQFDLGVILNNLL